MEQSTTGAREGERAIERNKTREMIIYDPSTRSKHMDMTVMDDIKCRSTSIRPTC
jgi:hypothetical protein